VKKKISVKYYFDERWVTLLQGKGKKRCGMFNLASRIPSCSHISTSKVAYIVVSIIKIAPNCVHEIRSKARHGQKAVVQAPYQKYFTRKSDPVGFVKLSRI
jgi:ribosomal protein L3